MRSRFESELAGATRPQSAGELADRGVTRAMTRGPAWRRTSRGWFVPAGVAGGTAQRLLDVAPLIPPGGALAGWAAAYVQGVDDLDGLDPHTMHPVPVTVNLGRDLGRSDRPGVRYVRDRLPARDRTVRYGLPVTTLPRTAVDGARWAGDDVEAVVFLDLVGRALGLSRAELQRVCAPDRPLAGVGRLRRALEHVDPASASPWESRLRMFYVGPAGLPRPLVNQPILGRDGRLLGIADLFDPEAGLVTEFDGQAHRERRQHRADNLREERLEAANLVVCRVDSLDLRQPAALAWRLRARHAQGLRRDRGQDHWVLGLRAA